MYVHRRKSNGSCRDKELNMTIFNPGNRYKGNENDYLWCGGNGLLSVSQMLEIEGYNIEIKGQFSIK